MFRLFLISLLCMASCFAKSEVETLPCGCPVDHNVSYVEKERIALPAPLSGIVTSMRTSPGLWTLGAVAATIAGVVLVVVESPNISAHSHS